MAPSRSPPLLQLPQLRGMAPRLPPAYLYERHNDPQPHAVPAPPQEIPAQPATSACTIGDEIMAAMASIQEKQSHVITLMMQQSQSSSSNVCLHRQHEQQLMADLDRELELQAQSDALVPPASPRRWTAEKKAASKAAKALKPRSKRAPRRPGKKMVERLERRGEDPWWH